MKLREEEKQRMKLNSTAASSLIFRNLISHSIGSSGIVDTEEIALWKRWWLQHQDLKLKEKNCVLYSFSRLIQPMTHESKLWIHPYLHPFALYHNVGPSVPFSFLPSGTQGGEFKLNISPFRKLALFLRVFQTPLPELVSLSWSRDLISSVAALWPSDLQLHDSFLNCSVLRHQWGNINFIIKDSILSQNVSRRESLHLTGKLL